MLVLDEVVRDQVRYREAVKELKGLEPLIAAARSYGDVLEDLRQAQQILDNDSDAELLTMAREEIETKQARKDGLEEDIRSLLLPRDPLDDKNIIMEIRAGTGGEEAALFAGDLYRMYSRYAEGRSWKTESLSSNPTGVGGFKEVIFSIVGDGAYSRLKFESGVHRVQRVPVTEASGRIHTSAVTVAVLPEAEEVDINIDPENLRIDVFRSSGPGGQSVNTTDSAVRITHLPTGLVVSCQDEKSQHKNKSKALKVIRARVLELEQEKQRAQISQDRRNQIGRGDRSEKIRTYNFPQNRVTDHRIKVTLHKLEEILEGGLEGLIDSLVLHQEQERLSGEPLIVS
ncbi:peptide chain release factor 1 [candidate division KSB1 bacterium]